MSWHFLTNYNISVSSLTLRIDSCTKSLPTPHSTELDMVSTPTADRRFKPKKRSVINYVRITSTGHWINTKKPAIRPTYPRLRKTVKSTAKVKRKKSTREWKYN